MYLDKKTLFNIWLNPGYKINNHLSRNRAWDNIIDVKVKVICRILVKCKAV